MSRAGVQIPEGVLIILQLFRIAGFRPLLCGGQNCQRAPVMTSTSSHVLDRSKTGDGVAGTRR